MKKYFLIVLCVSISSILMAQETQKQKEVGLIFSNLDNFGLTYKTGNNKALWRFTTLFLNGENDESKKDAFKRTQNYFGFGVKVGREYRIPLAENMELKYGTDLSFQYSRSKYELDYTDPDHSDQLDERTIYQPGLNLVFGFNYWLSDNIVLGVELLPEFSYKTGEIIEKGNYYGNGDNDLKSDVSGFNYGLSNNSALLSVAYKF
ncbi:hypothetical protein SAMN06265379_10998 [Saccharicrinis carchari]|uniref:Outer membrane protein beta-barrel domain-containing protein n=1 Tax=Saccharicrinis carchari TaxID=1168039 RepID=A0A521EKN3_SACCC|nr:hypothetical protein [Saccharicrinis carchari]SMO84474.1 hypothetical protein SAMN06265379_10998 [Saccharicrinis carchari]